MEKQTFILTALPNGFADNGRARFSVFISHRLWSDSAPPDLKLTSYPDLISWPDRLSAIDWSISIDGGAPIPVAPDSDAEDALKPAMWSALFTETTRVEPYLFDDHRGIPLEVISISTLHDLLADLYGRASADTAYGAGAVRPGLNVLGTDPDLMAVARPSLPEPEPEPSPHETAPVPFPHAIRPTENPDPIPEQPIADDGIEAGCAAGCFAFPLEILRRLLALLGLNIEPWAKGGLPPVAPTPPSSQPTETPSFDTGVTPPAPLPASPAGKIFLPPPLNPLQQSRHDAFQELTAVLGPEDRMDLPDADALADSWDFHQAVSALGDYPNVLRWLGLVVDLVLPEEAALAASGTISVVASDPGWSTATMVVSPRTHFISTTALFTAASRGLDPEIRDGFLRVDDSNHFLVVQNDVAGDVIKVSNTATHALRFANSEDRPRGMPDQTGLPALRTAGLSLVRKQATRDLKDQFVRSCAFNRFVIAKDASPETQPAVPSSEPAPVPTDELFAEDLVRGYRIDVHDGSTGVWRSLCERVGTYDFLDAQPPLEATDEGFVQLAVTEPRDPAATKKLRTTESLFTWSGWSLCAPRPGLAILPDDSHGDPANEATTGFRLETGFSAKPGSLPRLRFGRGYKLRARIADLAGNSVTDPTRADFQDDGPAVTPEITAFRYEPIAPPILMLRAAPIEGESLERLVVRTPAYGGLGQTTERHVAPPKTSQLTAELHGVFDQSAFDGSAASYALAALEANSVSDDAQQIRPTAESDPWIQPAPFVTVKYLPDPQARRVVFSGLPASADPNKADRRDFVGRWPERQPFRIELVAIAEGKPPAAPKWTPSGSGDGSGVLTVELAPAQTASVRINCQMDAADLDTRGVWEWTKQQAHPNLATVQADIIDGRHWAHLPWRDLTFVHAVQTPLAIPKIQSMEAAKALGQTFAAISGEAIVDNASTGRMQIRGNWSDWLDDPESPAPVRVPSSAELGEVAVPDSGVVKLDANSAIGAPMMHELHDDRYHQVAYSPLAVTRFREYFPAATNTPATTTLAGPPFLVDVLNSGVPAPLRFLYAVPLFEWDTPPGTPGVMQRSRTGAGLRLYLDRPWYSSGDGELLGVLFLDGAPFPMPESPETEVASVWGSDPIGRGKVTSSGAAQQSFPSAVALSASPLAVPGHDLSVSVAGYEPQFDSGRGLWYADVKIDCGDAYWPFVRLALARYQPQSIKGAHLSPVTRTNFIPVAPTRNAKIHITEPLVTVRVDGPVHEMSEAIGSFAPGGIGASNGLNEIELVVEELIASGDPADPLSWVELEPTRILIVQDPGSPGLWEGSVTLPGPISGSNYRVAVREYEWFRTDDAMSDDRSEYVFAQRLVYADAFTL